MKTIKKLFLLCLFCLMSIGASAYDFWAVNADGVTIYYNITSSTTCEVTRCHDSYYSGIVNIPASVTYKSKTYSVTSIGEQAFYGCRGLISITIPNTVTSIGTLAFLDCVGLTSVNIPNSVTSIGQSAFNNCSGLTSVTIPNSVTSIGSWAFCKCTGLTSVTIPNSVTSIGESAFKGCTSLPIENNLRYADTTYLVEAVDKTLSTYTIKEGTKWIGGYAFYNCYGLTSIEIPNFVTSIGEYAFFGCSRLTSVIIPNSVTSIGESAFKYCGLTSIEIPNSVTRIRDNAFYGNALEDVFVSWSKPIGVPTNVFDKNARGKILIALHVPIGKTNIYQSADVWRDFYDMQEWDPSTGIEKIEINATDEASPISSPEGKDLYNLQGQKVSVNGFRGIVIKNGKKYVVK